MYFSNSKVGEGMNILCVRTHAVNILPKRRYTMEEGKERFHCHNSSEPPHWRVMRISGSPTTIMHGKEYPKYLQKFQESTHYNVLNVAKHIFGTLCWFSNQANLLGRKRKLALLILEVHPGLLPGERFIHWFECKEEKSAAACCWNEMILDS